MTTPKLMSMDERRSVSLANSTCNPSCRAFHAPDTKPRRGCAVAVPMFAAAGLAAWAAAPQTAPRERGSVRVTSAAESDMAAVNHRAFTLPTAPMRKAARAGPTMTTRESRDWVRPMNFCRLRPSRSQTAGTRESRAVMPGMSPMAPRRPRATNHPKDRPHTMSTTGSRATLAADRMSETMETLRRLERSVSAPPIRPMTNWGTAQMSARVPAARASPVVASSTSGKMTPATELPRSEQAQESR